VTACDDRYLWPWACTVYSAIRNANVPIRFVLANVNGLLSPPARQVAKDFFTFLETDGEIVEVSLDMGEVSKYQWNATVFARLALLDSVDERFLWLDSDTILCGAWTKVFEVADELMENSAIIACGIPDRPATLDWLRKEGKNTAFRATKGAYINTGILIVDPLRWRREGMNQEWSGLVATQAERGFDFPDQDVLNYLLAGKVGMLPAGFNHIVSEPADGTESILHFAGAPKPWRLSESGQAFFIATEAANIDQAKDPMWGSGRAWELFPRYWEVERAVFATLRESGNQDLANSFSSYRESQLMPLPLPQRIKLWGIRMLSRRVLTSLFRR
jgi:UDP-glucose:(glucosyl)LPS alpha-1,3-glucosyltransferase/UDP-glucose:(galactosyl)LPS alpha-1,2-glucosyltransferase